MNEYMKNCDLAAIITALGGRQALQDLLDVGPSAISNYLARGELPQRAHAPVCEALRLRGYQVHPGSLEILGQTQLAGGTGPTTNFRSDRPAQRVLLIVGGGIAAYKALEVARRLQDHNVEVTGVMTTGAQQFITPLSLAALTASQVYTDLFSLTDEAEMGHIRLAREADLIIVAPATANLMARAANGLADDLATTILLATTAPVLMAPAMNPAMWQHPATAENVARLANRGIQFVGPTAGDMACGEDGVGRLAEPAAIVQAALNCLSADSQPDDLSGLHAIVTSGPTVEPIDSVRFIANRSSGKQGHAIASALAARGAEVTLVSGPVSLPAPANVRLVQVESATEMLAACEAALPANIAVCAAAVADWRVENASSGKLKKTVNGQPPSLTLVENPDILNSLSTHQHRPDLVIGFAAEASDLQDNARAKLARKGCDWIVANAVTRSDGSSVFNSDMNSASLITGETAIDWPMMTKAELAVRLVNHITDHMADRLQAATLRDLVSQSASNRT